ncbi:MAG: hypothetical protein ACLSAH_00610 [Bilophila wadsworthia]
MVRSRLASYLLEPEDRDYGWPKLSARWGTALGLSAANPGLLALTMTDQLLNGCPARTSSSS